MTIEDDDREQRDFGRALTRRRWVDLGGVQAICLDLDLPKTRSEALSTNLYTGIYIFRLQPGV